MFKYINFNRENDIFIYKNIINNQFLNKEYIDNNFKQHTINKFLSKDIFNKNMVLLYSKYRNARYIPCIIHYKLYKNNNLNYHFCIPFNKCLPKMIILNNKKNNDITNKQFALINYDNWNKEYPEVKKVKIIGNVDNFNNFLQYILYCKNLYEHCFLNTKASIFFSLKWQYYIVKESFIDDMINKYDNLTKNKENYIRNRIHVNTFTLDPIDCLIHDDAISIEIINSNLHIVSIYIVNVPLWIKYFNLMSKLTRLNLKDLLNDKNLNKINNKNSIKIFGILEQNFFSLIKNTRQISFTIDFIIENNKISKINCFNSIIKIKDNYWYNDYKLLNIDDYNNLILITRKLNIKCKILNKIKSGNDLIEYYMTYLNKYFSKMFSDNIHFTSPIRNYTDILYLYYIQLKLDLL